MEASYGVSSTAGNQSLDNRELPHPQEIPNSDQIYQQQISQQPNQNQSASDRPMEIPAAKVRTYYIDIVLIMIYFLLFYCTHSHSPL